MASLPKLEGGGPLGACFFPFFLSFLPPPHDPAPASLRSTYIFLFVVPDCLYFVSHSESEYLFLKATLLKTITGIFYENKGCLPAAVGCKVLFIIPNANRLTLPFGSRNR